MSKGRVIVFPILTAQLNGWPSVIRLTAAEARCLERAHLLGIKSLRTQDRKVFPVLLQAGMFDGDGLTPMGYAIGGALGQLEE